MRLSACDTIRAILSLARLAVVSRFNFGSAYWAWRRETAFGKHERTLSLKERVHSILEYGAWVWRMRRLM